MAEPDDPAGIAAAAGQSPDDGMPRGACAICGRPQVVRYRPFCSTRCADVDLHRWLGEQYAIPATETDDPDADDLAGGR